MVLIRVRFFSLYSDVAGFEAVLELKPGSSIAELFALLVERFPALKHVFEQVKPVILVNGVVASPDKVLSDGDEVAVIPPASGG